MNQKIQPLTHQIRTVGYFLQLSYKLSRKWSTVNLLLSFMRGVLPLLFIFAVKLFLDFATEAAQTETSTWQIIAFSAGIIFPLFFLRMLQEAWSPYAAEKLSVKVSDYIYKKIHQKSIALKVKLFDDSNYRNLFHRVSRDTQFRPARLVSGIGTFTQSTLALLIVAVVLFRFNLWVTLFLFALFIPAIVLQIKFAHMRYQLSWQQTQQERKAAYYSHVLTESVFARELRLFGLGPEFKRRFEQVSADKDAQKLLLYRKTATQETLMQLFFVIIITGLITFVAFQAVNEEISVSRMVLLILVIRRAVMFFQGLKQSTAQLAEDGKFLQDFLSFQKIQETEKTERVRKEAPLRQPPEIRFEGITFTYPGSITPALRNVTFRIAPGETIILAGANGSGKSTLIHLLARFYDPQEGRILINGTDIRQWPLNSLRAQMGILFQQYILYNETLRDNIRFGDLKKKNDDKRIKEAAVFSGIDPLARKLPNGYNTMLGNLFPNSHELSVGEWQKIAIARTAFRNAPIAIFDEPNSALDGEAEEHFLEQVTRHIQGKTAILVLHRLTWFHKKHRIVVLESGTAVEDGTFARLIQHQGALWRLYGSSFRF